MKKAILFLSVYSVITVFAQETLEASFFEGKWMQSNSIMNYDTVSFNADSTYENLNIDSLWYYEFFEDGKYKLNNQPTICGTTYDFVSGKWNYNNRLIELRNDPLMCHNMLGMLTSLNEIKNIHRIDENTFYCRGTEGDKPRRIKGKMRMQYIYTIYRRLN